MLRYGYSFKEAAGYGQRTRFILHRASAILLGLLGMALLQSGMFFMLGIAFYLVFLLAEFIFQGKSSSELLYERAHNYLSKAKDRYGDGDFRGTLKYISMAERHIAIPREFVAIKEEIENSKCNNSALLYV